MNHSDLEVLSTVFEELPVERRTSGPRMVRTMMDDRRQILRAIRELGDAHPFSDELATTEALDDFCRALSAYVAMAHFGVFRRISDGAERRAKIRRIAVVVFPDIDRSTEEILRFIERFRGKEPAQVGRDLTRALSAMSRTLRDRFKLEDQLLAEIDTGRRGAPPIPPSSA